MIIFYLSFDHISHNPGDEPCRGYDTDDADNVDGGPGDVVDNTLSVAAAATAVGGR